MSSKYLMSIIDIVLCNNQVSTLHDRIELSFCIWSADDTIIYYNKIILQKETRNGYWIQTNRCPSK